MGDVGDVGTVGQVGQVGHVGTVGDGRRDVAGGDAGERPVVDQPSVVQHEYPVHQAGHAVEVVGDHDQRHRGLLPKPCQDVDERPPGGDVEPRQRLVEDHQPGLAGDQSRERGAAHLPTGQVLDPPVPKTRRVEADRGERLVGGGGIHPGRRLYVSAHGGRQQLQSGVLHGQSDLAGAGGQRVTRQVGRAFRRGQQTSEDGGERRLARSVATADHDGLTGVETQGDVGQRPVGPWRPRGVDLPDAVETHQRGWDRCPGGHGRGSRCRFGCRPRFGRG